MIKIKRNKRKSKLHELAKKLLALDEQKASIGYFQDSGTHTLANMSYASLAYIHEFPELGKHEYRPVIGQIKPMLKGGKKQTDFFRRLLKDYVCLTKDIKINSVLDEIGQAYTQKAHHVFGNTALLVVTNNPTPLVDTGELEKNIGYKTSFNYTLRYV